MKYLQTFFTIMICVDNLTTGNMQAWVCVCVVCTSCVLTRATAHVCRLTGASTDKSMNSEVT